MASGTAVAVVGTLPSRAGAGATCPLLTRLQMSTLGTARFEPEEGMRDLGEREKQLWFLLWFVVNSFNSVFSETETFIGVFMCI